MPDMSCGGRVENSGRMSSDMRTSSKNDFLENWINQSVTDSDTSKNSESPVLILKHSRRNSWHIVTSKRFPCNQQRNIQELWKLAVETKQELQHAICHLEGDLLCMGMTCDM